jgi:hypothetical protein
MYYFKCSNCGHLNYVGSEYLIFCSNCGKKLQITYRDWHLKNPDKNLNDFHVLFCISENEIRNTIQTTPKKDYKKIGYLFIAIFITVSILIIESKIIPAFFINETELKEIKSETWTVKEIGYVSVQTPFVLVDAGSNIQNDIIEDFKSVAFTSDEGFEMLLTSIKYTENLAEQNLIGTSSDPINQMQLNSGISKLEFDKSFNNKNNINGIIYKGSYLRNNEKFSFILATYAKKSDLWQLIIIFKPDLKWEKFKAYRILNSFKINK